MKNGLDGANMEEGMLGVRQLWKSKGEMTVICTDKGH